MTDIKPGDHVRHLTRPDVHGVVTHLTNDRRGNPRAMVAGHPDMFNRADLKAVDATPTTEKFNVGDRVQRVSHGEGAMTVGSVWTVTSVTGDGLYLVGDGWGPRIADWFEPVTHVPSPRYVVATDADGHCGVLDTRAVGGEAFAGFGYSSTVENQRIADDLNAGTTPRNHWMWRAYDPPAGNTATDEPAPAGPALVDDGWWDVDLDGYLAAVVTSNVDLAAFGLEVRVQIRRKATS